MAVRANDSFRPSPPRSSGSSSQSSDIQRVVKEREREEKRRESMSTHTFTPMTVKEVIAVIKIMALARVTLPVMKMKCKIAWHRLTDTLVLA